MDVLKVENYIICLVFIKINDKYIYVKKDNINTSLCEKSFLIGTNDEETPAFYSKTGIQDDVNALRENIEDKEINLVENHPLCMMIFCYGMKKDNHVNITIDQNEIGKIILRGV